MTKEDFTRLQQNLHLPPHTPLKTQIDLLRDDILKLIAETMRLRNELHAANQERVVLFEQMQQSVDRAHADGANALRAAALEVACPACTEAIIQLTAERTFQ